MHQNFCVSRNHSPNSHFSLSPSYTTICKTMSGLMKIVHCTLYDAIVLILQSLLMPYGFNVNLISLKCVKFQIFFSFDIVVLIFEMPYNSLSILLIKKSFVGIVSIVIIVSSTLILLKLVTPPMPQFFLKRDNDWFLSSHD